MSCVFCRIIRGEIPAEVVGRDEGATAFLDVSPLADGHVLVIPHRHVARLDDLEASEAEALFRSVVRISGPIRDALGADGSTIGINNGEATGQTVPHVHVHIVPRWKNDGGGSIHSIFSAGNRRDVSEVGDLLRAALDGR